MSCTASAPSPTADAMRLGVPRRTSPAENTPGTFVSSNNGERVKGQWPPLLARNAAGRARPEYALRGAPSVGGKSGPVTMKPCPSRASRPSAQSVYGFCPIRMARPSAGTVLGAGAAVA